MPIPVALIGAALGGAGLIGKAFSRGKANRMMERLIKEDPVYKENPLARQRLGLARTLLNARMPGSIAAERNIFRNQANTMAGTTRAATDASQLLAMGGEAQGTTNDAIDELALEEAGDYQRRYDNVTGAEEGVIREGDKLYQDSVRRFGNKAQLKGAQASNNSANWGDMANFGFSLMDFGAAGGFQNMFGETNRSVMRGLNSGGVSRPANDLPRTYRNF